MKNRFSLQRFFAPAGEGEETTGGDETTTEGETLIGGDEGAEGEGKTEGSLVGGEEEGPEGEGAEPHPFDEELDPAAFREAISEEYEIAEDDESFTAFIDTINQATSREELAKNLMDMHAKTLESAAEATAAEFTRVQTEWQDAVKADPTYGKDNLDKSLAAAKTVALEYGGKDFLNLLNLTGAGNNLAMVAFLNKVHADLPKEGNVVAGNPSPSQRSLAERLFPSAEGTN